MRNISLNENAPPVDEDLARMPHYFHVPKDPVPNLYYRETILELAEDNVDFQQQLWIASSRDELFFVNTFLYVFEPREAVVLPFITWPFQDETFIHMDKAIGKTDMGVEKSRDMGISWMFLTAFFYRWMFRSRQTFGLVSRTEDAVDKRDDPDTLMWKLDFHLDNLPYWMRPDYERLRLSLKNNANNSVISGYAATGDVARGGRKTAFGFDEAASWNIDDGFAAWASTQHVTNSRVMVSTPKGMAGIFAEQMKKKDAEMLKLSLHWSLHPDKVIGLYRSTNGELEIIDDEYDFPPDYPFVLDGKLRSPWYDRECRRHPVPALISQELDIDYGGSGFPFFNAKAVDDHARKFACEPFIVGDIDYDEDHEPTFREMKGGPLRVWLHLTVEKKPPAADYVIGCDVATGTAGEQSTNSTASIVNKATGEKVGEYAINSQYPDKFADTVIALRKWFSGPSGDAFVGWERNGPGYQFGKHFMENSPHRVYYRESLDQHGGKTTKSPGWHSGKTEKRLLLGEYGKAIDRAMFVNHSLVALDEMLHYIHLPDGKIEHDRSQSTLDPTSAGENHGDRVIADALAWRLAEVKPGKQEKEKQTAPPYGSMAWRFRQQDERARRIQEAWL